MTAGYGCGFLDVNIVGECDFAGASAGVRHDDRLLVELKEVDRQDAIFRFYGINLMSIWLSLSASEKNFCGRQLDSKLGHQNGLSLFDSF